MPAMITVDAFAGRSFKAKVAKIGVLPDSSRWFMPDTKEYLVNLDLTTTSLSLKPGMTTQTEILFDTLKDVLFVPIQSVATLDGRATVWSKGELGPRSQVVEVGLNNDRFCRDPLRGVKEGDVIFMQAPGGGGAAPASSSGPSDGKSEENEENADKGVTAGEERKRARASGNGKKRDPARPYPRTSEEKVNLTDARTTQTTGQAPAAQRAAGS